MTARVVEQRLRLFLLGLAGFMCLGTVIELWLTEHIKEPIQLVPFILSGLGLMVVVAVFLRPGRSTIWALRIVMGLVTLGSLFGMYEHLEGNFNFALEIKPNAAVSATLWEALRGAAPLLAPGILALMALIAMAATYYHPVLGNRQDI
ncbi:MAG: hypothetical protein HYZ49_11680 [Chloroflexi bacterium]|nr:hypothetical protein [Chloroflexota bacterium]